MQLRLGAGEDGHDFVEAGFHVAFEIHHRIIEEQFAYVGEPSGVTVAVVAGGEVAD